jgi:cell division septal protein FtsQ
VNERRVRPMGRQIYGRQQSYNQQRPSRSKLRRPTLSLWQRRLLIVLVLVGTVGYGLWHLFAIKDVQVKAASGAGEVRTHAQKIIGSAALMGNLLTLNEQSLESKLQQADPALRNVKVSRRPWHTVVISAVFKQPSLGWSTGDQLYLLDSDGTVIGSFPSGYSLPAVVDSSNLPVHPGQQVASAHFVAFVQALAPALKIAGYKVNGISIKDTTLDLTAATDKGYSLIFDSSRNAGDEMADLRSVQTLLTQQKKTPSAYIDLRIAGKAYWK